MIDLVHIAKSGFPVDNGYDPVRNSFMLLPVMDGDNSIRFEIRPAFDDLYDFDRCMKLYELLVDAGFPVKFTEQLLEDVQGNTPVELSMDDPRVDQLGLKRPPAYSEIQPLTEPSLDSFEAWISNIVKP